MYLLWVAESRRKQEREMFSSSDERTRTVVMKAIISDYVRYVMMTWKYVFADGISRSLRIFDYLIETFGGCFDEMSRD